MNHIIPNMKFNMFNQIRDRFNLNAILKKTILVQYSRQSESNSKD